MKSSGNTEVKDASYPYVGWWWLSLHLNRQNQISAMSANSWYIEGEVPEYYPPNCTILVWADPGTCDILPTMHCKLVKMEDN